MQKDLTNNKFGRLTAIIYAGKTKDRHSKWLCRCDCGNEVVVNSNLLTSGHTKSCGCLRKENVSKSRYKHGGRKSHNDTERLYYVWVEMRSRCNNTKNKEYRFYGGKGIKVCKEWDDYSAFRKWAIENGYDKNADYGKCTIDRIDNNGDYEPKNCRWVSMAVQNKNKGWCEQ